MKRILLVILILPLFFNSCKELNGVLDESNNSLSEEEVAQALKEALHISSDSVTNWLHQVDAYYKDMAIRIIFPPEAYKVKQTLERNGFKSLVDDVELKMNRTAEDAAIKAKPIFFSAVDSITIEDAMAILQGSDSAATMYLKAKTYDQLYKAYYPEIKTSMETVGLQSTWNTVMTTYNLFTTDTVNTDITDYTTRKALDGLFYKIAQEEKAIREDPVKRVTDLLKKVFGSING